MGDPSIENRTGLAFEPLFLADEELRPLFVPVVKGTFAFAAGGLSVAEEQERVCMAGAWWGLPGESSYRLEPECAFTKPATDVVLLAEAHAPRRGATEALVGFQVGALRKAVRVVGDRAFYKGLVSPQLTRPAPFEAIPLTWERAFGGWDRTPADPRRHQCEPRNPVGVGFRAPGSVFQEGARAPNLEDPARPFQGWGDRPAPAGFGFLCPEWQPRASLAGTYGPEWDRSRKPLLPVDFDPRFFNAASPGLIASGHLRGDEQVVVTGVAPGGGGYSFRLPAGHRPRVSVSRQSAQDAEVPLALDTVIVDAISRRLYLLWRGLLRLRRDPAELTCIRVAPAAG